MNLIKAAVMKEAVLESDGKERRRKKVRKKGKKSLNFIKTSIAGGILSSKELAVVCLYGNVPIYIPIFNSECVHSLQYIH